MKNLIVVFLAFAFVVACSGAPANYIGRRCTSAVQCGEQEVCWTYSVSTSSAPERGANVVRDGYCGKLSSDK